MWGIDKIDCENDWEGTRNVMNHLEALSNKQLIIINKTIRLKNKLEGK